MTDIPQPPVAPLPITGYPVAPVKKSSPVLAVILVLLLLIIALGALTWFFGPLKGMVANAKGALMLHGASVVTEAKDGSMMASKIGIFGMKHISAKNVSGTISEYVTSGAHKAAIVQSTGGGQDVFVLDGASTQLTMNGGDKQGLSMSADGAYVAYAEFHPQQAGETPMDSTSLADWSVNVITVANKDAQIFESSSYPVFFSLEGTEYVGMVSQDGVRVVNLGTATAQTIAMSGTDDAQHRLSVASDGSRLAVYNTVSDQYVLYSLKKSETEVSVSLVKTLPEDVSVLALAVMDGMYLESATDAGTVISFVSDADVEHAEWTYLLKGSALYSLIP